MRTIAVEEEDLRLISICASIIAQLPQQLTSNWSTKASMPALSPVKYLGPAILGRVLRYDRKGCIGCKRCLFFNVCLVAEPKNPVEVWRARTNNIQIWWGVSSAWRFGGTLLAEDGVIEMPSVGL